MANPNRPLPPLDLLRGFEAAARHLSFTRAATELFLTQSAVSRQIQALEAFVGAALFERRHKALALTEAGEAYHRAVAAALDQLREATRKVQERQQRARVLNVATTISFASMWLVPRLAGFRKEHPGIDVRISASHLVADLEREGIDLAIRDLPLDRVPAGAVHLVGEHLAAVCAPSYLRESKAARRPLRKPEDLRHHVLLQFEDPTGRWTWLMWPSWLEAHGAPGLVPANRLTFNQYDQLLQAAMHGHGVALGRMSIARQYIRDKRLVALFGGPENVARAFHAVFAKDARARPEVEQFVQWLQRELQEKPGTDPISRKVARRSGRR